MKIRFNLKLFGVMTLWCGVLGACNSQDVYHVFHPVAETGWERDDTLRFLFNLPDTTVSYAFSVELRHRLDFPYTDLPVDMTLATAHDSILWRDTLSIPVADVWGNWVGKGWGDLRTVSSPVVFLSVGRKDTLQLHLQPALADSLLPGVNDVGVYVRRMGETW